MTTSVLGTLLEAAREGALVRLLEVTPGRCVERKGSIVGGGDGIVMLSDNPKRVIRWDGILEIEKVTA